MRIRFIGEASSDIGGESAEGVVPMLTRKILESRGHQAHFQAEPYRFYRLHGKGFSQKAKVAVTEAQRDGCDAIVMVMDNDRQPHGKRLRALKEGMDEAAKTCALPVVAGVAIETLEAWLLADERALKNGLGLKEAPPKGPDPESLNGIEGSERHPKTALKGIFARDSEERSYATRSCLVAEAMDVEVVKRRCRAGFRPFETDVWRCLGPLFAPSVV